MRFVYLRIILHVGIYACCKMQLILIPCLFFTVVYGLEFVPRSPNPESSLIYYKISDEQTSLHYRNEIDKLLAGYTRHRSDHGSNILQCMLGIPPEKGNDMVCNVDVREYGGPCASSTGYSYSYNSFQGGPCIFLKPNKVANWIPEYYNSSTIPEKMPYDLTQHIRHIEEMYGADSNRLKVLWVICEGENPADRENVGPLQYFPNYGFDGQYFPIENEDHYMSPLIAVYFEKPQLGVLINIECKVWARNLHDELVHLELLVDL